MRRGNLRNALRDILSTPILTGAAPTRDYHHAITPYRQPTAAMNWHRKHKQSMSRSDSIAEWGARRTGSMPSIVAHTLASIAVWLVEMELQAMLLWPTTIVWLEAIYSIRRGAPTEGKECCLV